MGNKISSLVRKFDKEGYRVIEDSTYKVVMYKGYAPPFDKITINKQTLKVCKE